MTTNNLVTVLRTLLDEVSAGFWEDSEIYKALDEGQNSLIKLHLAVWKSKIKVNKDEELPETLRVLLNQTTGTGTTSLPTGFLEYISIYGDVPIYVRNQTRKKGSLKNNSLLESSASQVYCSFNGSQVVFETSVSWTMDYLKIPDAISSSQNPVLPDTCQDILINYAFSELMRKDGQLNYAADAYNRFLSSAQAIY